MEVAFVSGIVIDAHAVMHIGLHLQSAVNDECAAGLYERGVVAE